MVFLDLGFNNTLVNLIDIRNNNLALDLTLGLFSTPTSEYEVNGDFTQSPS